MTPSERSALQSALDGGEPLVRTELAAERAEDARALAAASGRQALVWSVTGAAPAVPGRTGSLAAAAHFLHASGPLVLLLRDLPPPPFDIGRERSLAILGELAAQRGSQVIVFSDPVPGSGSSAPAPISSGTVRERPDGGDARPGGHAGPAAIPTASGQVGTVPGRAAGPDAIGTVPGTFRDQGPETSNQEPGDRNQKPGPSSPEPAPPAALLSTGLALVLLVAGFAVTVLDGFHNDAALILLGAKVNSLIAAGEGWRLASSVFLSGSAGHLALNLATLILVGGAAEQFYGRARLLAIFVLSGAAGAGASYFFHPEIAVHGGAAIAGMLGALLVHERRHGSPEPPPPSGLGWLGLLVLAQAVAVVWVPRVDPVGAGVGLATGALLGFLLESRAPGSALAERDRLLLPAAGLTGCLVLFLGGLGLAVNVRSHLPLVLGGLAARQGNPERAAQAYAVTLDEYPHVEELRLYLARLYLATGNPGGAARQFEAYLDGRPPPARVHFEYAEALARSGAADDAVAALDRCPELPPSPREELAVYALLQTARWPDVRRHFREHAAAHGRSPAVRDALANALVQGSAWMTRAGSPRWGVEALEEALVLASDARLRATAEYNLAYLLADELNERLPEALHLVQSALRVEPRNAAFLDTLAWVYYRLGRYEEALEVQLRAVGRPFLRRGASAEMYYHLGAIREALGEETRARADYERALEHDATYAPAQEALRRLEAEAPSNRSPGGVL